jgi:hypothetical protein
VLGVGTKLTHRQSRSNSEDNGTTFGLHHGFHHPRSAARFSNDHVPRGSSIGLRHGRSTATTQGSSSTVAKPATDVIVTLPRQNGENICTSINRLSKWWTRIIILHVFDIPRPVLGPALCIQLVLISEFRLLDSPHLDCGNAHGRIKSLWSRKARYSCA